MVAQQSVYILKPVLDDPRFRGFVIGATATSCLGYESAYEDFLVENGESLDWRPRKLRKAWKAIEVLGAVNVFNDYPCLELSKPVFSRRAVEALGEMLTTNGELLPLKSEIGDYYAYVVLTKIDALDVKNSRLTRTSTTQVPDWIYYFSFKTRRIANATIFRIPEEPNLYFVTDRFKDRVEQAQLNGFDFIKVWPLPKGSDWEERPSRQGRSRSKRKLVGEALILRFRLKKDKPTPSEKNNAKTIEQSLRSKLSLSSLDDMYWGSIEVTEFENGEYRIFCTCPDCEALVQHLQDWFKHVPWDHDFDIVKRFGNLYDAKAKEKRIPIRSVSE